MATTFIRIEVRTSDGWTYQISEVATETGRARAKEWLYDMVKGLTAIDEKAGIYSQIVVRIEEYVKE